jgi:hypothetical protein
VSEGHQVSHLGKRSGLDIGGDFHTFKSEVVYLGTPSLTIDPKSAGVNRVYNGPVFPSGVKPLTEAQVPLISVSSLNALGATAVSRCSPVDSRAEALTSIAETLKDGLPALAGVSTWKNRASLSRGAGSEYLNAQFGWLPLVSDVKAVANSYKNAAKIMTQLKRDSGRNVRRSYAFPIERKTEVLLNTQNGTIGTHVVGAVGFPTGYWTGSFAGHKQITRETTVKRWFSGAFTYHVPSTETQAGKVVSAYQMFDHLFGVGLTPDVLWNLTPWSWATDWFANTGDVLSNVSNSMLYGQVLRYGYIMEETTIIDRHTVSANTFISGSGPYVAVVKTVVKRRIRANPFGFGITFGSLNAYQLSILAALGMSKR